EGHGTRICDTDEDGLRADCEFAVTQRSSRERREGVPGSRFLDRLVLVVLLTAV
ncbi:MAG: hypothetical protein QOI27_994, partial [Gaiellaceae bacterium]|nr:hypothetical protein [Gaiellaceae bacterium]